VGTGRTDVFEQHEGFRVAEGRRIDVAGASTRIVTLEHDVLVGVVVLVQTQAVVDGDPLVLVPLLDLETIAGAAMDTPATDRHRTPVTYGEGSIRVDGGLADLAHAAATEQGPQVGAGHDVAVGLLAPRGGETAEGLVVGHQTLRWHGCPHRIHEGADPFLQARRVAIQLVNSRLGWKGSRRKRTARRIEQLGFSRQGVAAPGVTGPGIGWAGQRPADDLAQPIEQFVQPRIPYHPGTAATDPFVDLHDAVAERSAKPEMGMLEIQDIGSDRCAYGPTG